jgi:hypothetical protein
VLDTVRSRTRTKDEHEDEHEREPDALGWRLRGLKRHKAARYPPGALSGQALEADGAQALGLANFAQA